MRTRNRASRPYSMAHCGVYPYDIPTTITVIDKVLSMGRERREGCRYRDIDFVPTSQSDKLVKNVLQHDLKDATSVRQNTAGSESNSQMTIPYGASMTPGNKQQEDTTAAFLSREMSQAFSHYLHLKDLKRAYDATQRRVIILDFNGSIVIKVCFFVHTRTR
jgi:trehalose 6-phosphate synthase/phosphatase